MIIIKSCFDDLIINPDSIFWQNRGPEVDPVTGKESEANKDLCFMVMARKSGAVSALTGRITEKTGPRHYKRYRRNARIERYGRDGIE